MQLSVHHQWTVSKTSCNECGTVASLHLDEQDVFLVERFKWVRVWIHSNELRRLNLYGEASFRWVLWTWLWGRCHVPQNVFQVIENILSGLISLAHRVLNKCSFVSFLLSFEKSSYFFLLTFKYSQTNKCRPMCIISVSTANFRIYQNRWMNNKVTAS